MPAPSRTQLGITCPYCNADPHMPCEAVDADPINGACLIQGEIDLEHTDTP
jgi:hypothetical protein